MKAASRKLVLAGLGAAVAVAGLTVAPPEARAADPVVYSIVEGQPVNDRGVLVVLGKSVSKFRTFEIQDDTGTSLGDATALTRTSSMLVLSLPETLPPGSYDLVASGSRGLLQSHRVRVTFGILLPGIVEDQHLSQGLRGDLGDATTLEGQDGSFYRDASNLVRGTVSPALYSAIDDLVNEGRIGRNGDQVARGDHDHDGVYAEASDLATAGTVNAAGNPVDWSRLKNVPAGIADGSDDSAAYAAGKGLTLSGNVFDLIFGGTGTRDYAARSDHDHDSVYAATVHDHDLLYYRKSALDVGGTLNDALNPLAWTRLKGVPSGFADGVDDNSTYAAGDGMKLAANVFSLDFAGSGTATTAARSDHSHDGNYFTEAELFNPGTLNDAANPVDWTRLKGVPAGFADGTDADTTYTAGAGLALSGGAFSLNFGGPGSTSLAARSDHDHDTRYFTESELSTPGTVNTASNPVDWTRLKNMPLAFSDGVDDDTLFTAGTGLSLTGTSFSVNFAGTGTLTTSSRSDHDHDLRYFTEAELSTAGTLNAATNPVDWTKLKGMPLGFADGIDSTVFTETGADAYRASGRLGIGTTAPTATLHVVGNDGALFSGTFGSGTIPATGAGTRMMWYPKKAAFRAGAVNSSQWDDTNIGTYSLAAGLESTASGIVATAFGGSTIASGNYATAMGNSTNASGVYSAALGLNTTASGVGSTAMGERTTASGVNSVAMGLTTTARSYGCVALGYNNVDSGTSTSIVTTDPILVVGNGDSPSATSNALTLLKNGDLSIAGRLSVPSVNGVLFSGSFGQGALPATGGGTRMMWYPRKAAFRTGAVNSTQWDDTNVGTYSVATGLDSTASGIVATALGGNTVASGNYSTATGQFTTANGTFATATGQSTTASGTHSTAAGHNTTASGVGSVAMGEGTTANGTNSVAMGLTTTAQAYGCVALGYNNVAAGSTTSIVATDPILVVGNGGSPASTSNAFTLLKNGNLTIAGTLTENSDERLKADIAPLTGVLAKLAAIRGVSYRFQDERTHPAGRQIGLLAQEVRDAFPELVHEDAQGTLSVAYGKFEAVLLEAVKEQQAVIEAREREIADLRKELAAARSSTEERLARIEAALAKSAAK